MRVIWLAMVVLLGSVQAAWAAATTPELVNKAVAALNSTCYEARMRFMSQFEAGAVQKVHIWHVAPELYRVEPLKHERTGQWNTTGVVYFEDARELVRFNPGTRKIEALPVRQFSINDNLTIKFLRDLADSNAVSVLEGWVGDYAVYFLRHDMTRELPYGITVGLDRQTSFPLFLVVTDAQGAQRVYYEMEAIEYRPAAEIDVSLFTPPAQQQREEAPRVKRNTMSSAAPLPASAEDLAEGTAFPWGDQLPLYPSWLPEGYLVEGLLLLTYIPLGADADSSSLVYQFEIFGPRLYDMISLFQTRASDVGLDLEQRGRMGEGIVVDQQGDWIITILGDQDPKVLNRIIKSLAPDPQRVADLLRQTQKRDEIYQRAVDP